MEQVKDANGNINCYNCENCFNCVNCNNCKNCNNCIDCWHLYDCDNCVKLSSNHMLSSNDTAKYRPYVLNINDTHTVQDYPYGSLRTEVTFRTEYKSGHGFRSVFQSTNPKTGRINKPKYGTYSNFSFNYKCPDTGHIKNGGCDFNGSTSVNPFCSFVAQHFDLLQLSTEMIKGIYRNMFISMQISAKYVQTEDKEAVNALMSPVYELIKEAYKTGENVFNKIHFPLTELRQLDPTF